MNAFWTILWAVVTVILVWYRFSRESWDERGRRINDIASTLSYCVLIMGLMLLFLVFPLMHINYLAYRTTVQIIVILGLTVEAGMILYQRRKF